MEIPDKCPLCEHEDSEHRPNQSPHTIHYSCPRCGQYHIAELALKHNDYALRQNAFELACVAHEWNLAHPNRRFVLADEGHLPNSAQATFPHCRIFSFDEMLGGFPKPYKCLDRALLNCSHLVDNDPFERLMVKSEDAPYHFFSAMNWRLLVEELESRGLLTETPVMMEACSFVVTSRGWQRIEELTTTVVDSSQCFIAMWFDESMDAVQDALREGIALAGYEPLVVSDVEHNGKVCDEIIAQIRQSRFIVADFTAGHCPPCEDCSQKKENAGSIIPRGGVYFEAGYAMGLGIPVIWTVRRGQMDAVHFDTNHYSHIIYSDPADLKVQLKNRIEATIGKGPL